jgi:predicted RNase H-like HicB family nuclease
MTVYQVYLDTSDETLEEGGYLAHVQELPGCVARGATKEEALAKVVEAVDAYLALMRRHGGPAGQVADTIQLHVIETQEPTLPSDSAPLSDGDLEDIERRGAATRADLLDLLSRVPDEALDWHPDDDTWSTRNVLAHLAGSDLWYASRLEPEGLPELLWRLDQTRAILLRNLCEAQVRNRALERHHMGEPWTARKVARRMLEHEQEHADHIRQILARYAAR